MPNLFIFRWPGYSQSVVDWEMEKSKPVDLLTISVRHVASPCAGNMQQRYPWWLRTQSGGVVISQEVMIGLFALWAMVEPLMWQRVTRGDRVATCVCPQKSNPICLISRPYMRWSVAESERERWTTNNCAGGQRCAVDKLFVHAFCLSLPAVKKGSCSSSAQRKERKEIEAGERAWNGVWTRLIIIWRGSCPCKCSHVVDKHTIGITFIQYS